MKKISKEVQGRNIKPVYPTSYKRKKVYRNCPHEDCEDPETCRTLFKCKYAK